MNKCPWNELTFYGALKIRNIVSFTKYRKQNIEKLKGMEVTGEELIAQTLSYLDRASQSYTNATIIAKKVFKPKRVPYYQELLDRIAPRRSETTTTGTLSRCRPWNFEDYVTRLNSFTIYTWFAKPAIIGAAECARHGWSNIKMDTIQCPCCKNILCFFLNDKLSMEVYKI